MVRFLLPPSLTDKVKLLVPAIACCVVATLFLVGLVGADARRSANDEPGDVDPVEAVRPADGKVHLSVSDSDREAYEVAVTAMIDAASRAGYRLDQTRCRLYCTDAKEECPGLPTRHKAPVTPVASRLLGTGDHQLCEGGDCVSHRHYSCPFPGSDVKAQLFEDIADGDWAGVAARIAETDHLTYNRERHAIQGLDCTGDHLALHLPAPSEFVEFMDQ